MAPQIEPRPIAPTRVAQPVAVPAQNGTINTSAGPISWSRAVDGTVTASGNGQQLTMTGSQANDGSSQNSLVFSRSGQSPYLTMQAVVQQTQNTATLTVTAGQSHLTLALTGFNRSYSSATAKVTGSLAGSAATVGAPIARRVGPGTIAQNINWTGTVDLTKNPLMGNLIPGWPQQAFASELKEAAFFGPLGKALLQRSATQPHAGATGGGSGGRGGLQQKSLIGSIVKAVICGGIGVLAAGATGGASLELVAWGLAGADASLVSDDVTLWEQQRQGPPDEPPPNPDLPLPPDDSGPSTQVSHEDPPPGDGGSGDGGGGGNPDDDKPQHEED